MQRYLTNLTPHFAAYTHIHNQMSSMMMIFLVDKKVFANNKKNFADKVQYVHAETGHNYDMFPTTLQH